MCAASFVDPAEAPSAPQKLDTTRKKMYAKANGEVEVHWDQILEKAGLAGVVDPTTAARNLKEAGYTVQTRKPREKPCQVDRALYRHGRLGIPKVGYGPAPNNTYMLSL